MLLLSPDLEHLKVVIFFSQQLGFIHAKITSGGCFPSLPCIHGPELRIQIRKMILIRIRYTD
jgi:hypothetical protein